MSQSAIALLMLVDHATSGRSRSWMFMALPPSLAA
jgi:hypothetical protein